MSSLDDQIRSALDRVVASVSGHFESELRAIRSDIVRAAADAEARAVSEATTRAAEAGERAAAEVRRGAEEQLAQLHSQFEQQRDELERDRTVEVAGLQRSLEELREELAAVRRELGDERQTRETLEALIVQNQHEAELRLASVQEQFERQRADLEQARASQVADLQHAVEQLRDECQQSEESAARHLGEAEAAVARAQEESEAIRREVLRVGRVARDLRTLESAVSLGDVLDALAAVACQEAGRAAVFLVEGGQLKGWRARGFATADSIVGSHLEPVEAGLLGEALASGRQDYRDGAGMALPAFAADEVAREGVALPVEVAGSVIAVLYADAPRSDNREGPPWTDMVDVMAKYAGRLLETMTVRRAAALWSPRRTTAAHDQLSLRSE